MGNCKGNCLEINDDNVINTHDEIHQKNITQRNNENDTTKKIEDDDLAPQKVYTPVKQISNFKLRSIPNVEPIDIIHKDNKEELLRKLHENMETVIKQPPIKFESGIIYEGEWLNGQRNGDGIQFWPCGTRYDGKWCNDKAHGDGIIEHANGEIYKGQWKYDKASGHGEYSHTNGTKYIGEFEHDQFHGKGIETWSDNTHYEGEFNLGQKHGKGKQTFANGNIYDGDFENGSQHGIGNHTDTEGKVYQGIF